MKYLIYTAILMLFASVSLAGEEYGTVRFQHGQYFSSANSAGKLFFYLEGGQKSGTPACASISERWVIDNDSPAAQMQLSILIAAYMSDKEVVVRGFNSCSVWGDAETARDIIFGNWFNI